MSSRHYLDFIGSVYDLLPEEDKDRLGELWEGYEQIAASITQKYLEVDLNLSIEDLQENTTERWLPFVFSSMNFINRQAVIVSTQDISNGINLSQKRRLRFRIDGVQTYEVDCQGVVPFVTTISEVVETLNLAVGFNFASTAFEGTVLKLSSPTAGVGSSIEILETENPALNACEFLLGVTSTSLPRVFPLFRYPYKLPYKTIASIPILQDAVRDESITLSMLEGIDYIVEPGGIITFSESPIQQLWARRTFVNEETPYNNFGFLMDIYQENSSRYVQVLQGLWFAFWNGPRPINVKRSLYLLFGLPTAPGAGLVTQVTPSLVGVTLDTGEVANFSVPSGLEPLVMVGESVEKFDPLTTGIEIFDKINFPGFISEEVGRAGIQRFLLDEATRGPGDTDETRALKMLEEHTFLPQINVNAFINPFINLENVKTFLNTIKPKSSTYLFQIILGAFKDLIAVEDMIEPDIDLDVTSSLDLNETCWQTQALLDAYETSEMPGLDLDLDGVAPGDRVAIEVRTGSTLIDSFSI